MPVQTPTLVKGTPRRSPSIDFRESPLRSASRAKPTTSRDHHSTDTKPELPSRRSPAAHWRSQLAQEDRVDPTELCKKLSLLSIGEFGEDFIPRPVQIEALAGLFQLERFKSRNAVCRCIRRRFNGFREELDISTSHVVGYEHRAVTIVVSPLTALSQHHADTLNQERKKAVVICKETWGDGELHQQLSDPSHTVSFIFISPEMHNGDERWAELISKDSFRERVKLLAYDETIKIAE